MVYIVRAEVLGRDGELEVYRTELEAMARAHALKAAYDRDGGEWHEGWTSDGYEVTWYSDEDDDDYITIQVVPIDL